MSDDIMLSLLNNNRPNHKPPPPPAPPCSFNDGGGGSAPAAGLNPLVKPFAPRYFSGETVNPLHAALRAARARAEQQVGNDDEGRTSIFVCSLKSFFHFH